MKILFVRSGNCGFDPISDRQANSLVRKGLLIKRFEIKGRGLIGYLVNIIPLYRIIKIESPDLIHAHYGLSGMIAFIVKRKKKLVVSFMGDDILGSNNSDGEIKPLSKLLIKANLFLACRFYDFSIVKTEEMLTRFYCSNVERIPNGVDLYIYKYIEQSSARIHLGIALDIKLVIFVSDPSREEKNFKLAERAIKTILTENILLLCVFDKSQEDLVNFYNAADLLILTSFHEGSPNVVKEAMACNCPVVSTEVGDVKWIFGDTPGYFIARYDPSDIAEKIILALKFRKEFHQTAGRGRLIKIGLDSETIADKIIEVYKTVLS
jgi:teichuronic acid biosynthesis glycosyltransferase TuaC